MEQYWLSVGTTAGGMGYYNGDMGTSTSYRVNWLAVDGSAVFVRLYSRIGDDWYFRDHAYTAFDDVSQYWLSVGATAGGTDYFNGEIGGALSYVVSGLPTDGRTVYVRLYSKIGEDWFYKDFTYTAAGGSP